MTSSGRRALLHSLLALLRDKAPAGFGLPEGESGLASYGRPPTVAGKYFWGLHGGGVSRTALTSYVEQPVIQVTLSVRVNEPTDRIAAALTEVENGIDDRLGALQAFLARNQYQWMNAANTWLAKYAGAAVNGFYHPVFQMNESQPREVGPDWWRAPPPSGPINTTPGPAGVTADLTLSGFQREQYLETAL